VGGDEMNFKFVKTSILDALSEVDEIRGRLKAKDVDDQLTCIRIQIHLLNAYKLVAQKEMDQDDGKWLENT